MESPTPTTTPIGNGSLRGVPADSMMNRHMEKMLLLLDISRGEKFSIISIQERRHN